MALTQTTFNAHKIKIYCCLGEYLEEYYNKRKYSIKDCEHMLDTLALAAAMFAVICPMCLDADDENYYLTNEELEYIVTTIENMLHYH
jgi:hypothetical protein